MNTEKITLTARTNNKNEMNPETAKIGDIVNFYFSKQVADQFNHRINPGVTYIAYTGYESDEHGDYTFFIGEAIKNDDTQDLTTFTRLEIPAGDYQKFTSKPGTLPAIVISTWQEIWKMKAADLGGKRKYHTDFEVYDHRAADPSNAVIDICIGINE
jgi:predicted transcriptional regulator YdeE